LEWSNWSSNGTHSELTGRVSVKASQDGPSIKAQLDQVELELKLLRLGVQTGELLRVNHVVDDLSAAVSAMREEFANRRRSIAEKICSAPSQNDGINRVAHKRQAVRPPDP
jgi:hypothetical protein